MKSIAKSENLGVASRTKFLSFPWSSHAWIPDLQQMRLLATQSECADRLASAVESERQCTSQMRSLIDQISVQQGKIVALEEEKKLQDEEFTHLKALVQDLEKKGLQSLLNNLEVPVAAVVIMACNRPDYLQRTIQSVLKYQTSVASKFPLFVSQDGTNRDVKNMALSFKQLTYLQHLDFTPVHTERPGELIAYYKIARHYKWALDELFIKHNFSRVIILEDDMEIAPDFFDYFEATASILENDKTIMAVSSWNDNGQVQFVHDPKTLYRSDFFPGLGWMLSKSIWDELSPKWPKAYWDDWIRLKEIHRERQFIHPEVCRTYNFGEHQGLWYRSASYRTEHIVLYQTELGSSMGQYFKKYLEPIKLNDVHVDWKTMDLSYLTEDGIPRTAYKGVVVFRHQTSRRIYLVGPDSLKLLGLEHS
ncbi:alpha-1,3-mannosyl-glycoprotein 2-beta-N-acetylglucosaminyltransferase-like isoform X7 [Phoenix dactylifera]|uniref:Alpha-1,3-mannosyl-glycoprotein 2-beta-N-acetylglucosaminyltransferase n=1 Tax=Phoenix dactylifera TaxID=42345 RepID=A0A8B8J6R8_PHODC|nr:alpha-1,3-mannosyl-glycoprotein 2-beta-N-acetylglucosaminyltransferase-like isoform X7 [Phoenix dactylifera]